MHRPLRPLLAALTTSVLIMTPAPGMGESLMITQGNSGASLDFRIIIPPIMRVLENSHPRQLDTIADGKASAEQRLVVLSNMKGGVLRLVTACRAPTRYLGAANCPTKRHTPQARGRRLQPLWHPPGTLHGGAAAPLRHQRWQRQCPQLAGANRHLGHLNLRGLTAHLRNGVSGCKNPVHTCAPVTRNSCCSASFSSVLIAQRANAALVRLVCAISEAWTVQMNGLGSLLGGST